MNIVLWILQALLAIHTVMGALWKFSHSEQAAPTLEKLPHTLWLGLIPIELLAGLALVVAAVHRPLSGWILVGVGVVIAEMLLFSIIHLASGATNHGPMAYWLIVAALAGFILYGRLALSPL